MRLKAMTFMTAAAVAVALGPSLAAVGSTAAAVTGCKEAPGVFYEYVASKGTDYFVAAHVNNVPHSQPELKTFPGNVPNGTAQFIRCTNSAGQIAFLNLTHGNTTALSNNPSDGSRTDLDPVTSSGPNNSMWWVQAGSNPYTFRNTDTGLYLRVSNRGLGEYYPVVAGAHATAWTQLHSS